ncbi:MAG: hypothetical protein PHU95_07265, partial [Candidatus Thermoplasmatota archaeon]|nr:hypothetical protein [Candidatus Thermoplasmatota archaeon]
DVLAVDYEVTRKGIVCMDEEGHRFNINGRLGWEAKAILDEDGKIVLEVEYSRKTGLGQAAGRFRFPAVKRIRRVE